RLAQRRPHRQRNPGCCRDGIPLSRGSGLYVLGRAAGGLPPDALVENEAAILRDCRRVIETYHDNGRYAMVRVVLAPCSPFSVSPSLMRESVQLARAYGAHAHTHLAETRDEAAYCAQKSGRTPVEFAEELGWVGPDVWHAHMVHPSADEIAGLVRTRTGVAPCPTSHLRTGP